MKRSKRIFTGVVLVHLLSILLTLQVFAADFVNISKNTSLTIYNKYDTTAISGVSFQVYHLCTVDAGGEITPTDEFKAFASELDIRGKDDDAWGPWRRK